MPLDSHSYLVGQGWAGTGTALRVGALARPLAVAQKKTLAGLGKDRDEAFPFWDHLFTAAASAIKLKLDSDEEEDTSDSTPETSRSLARTTTGIISNRRPVAGTPADTSGASTPTLPLKEGDQPRLSLIAAAKREAARSGLYSRFFRGPVLGPDSDEATNIVRADVMVSKMRESVEPGPSKKRRKLDQDRDEKGQEEWGAKEAKAARKAERATRRARKTKRAERRLKKEDEHERLAQEVQTEEVEEEAVETGMKEENQDLERMEHKKKKKRHKSAHP